MANQPNSSFNAGGRTRAVALGQRLSGVALLAALLAGCDNSVAHNAPPPPPVVADAEDEAKRRATDFAEQLAAYVDREQHAAPPPRAAEGVRDDPKPSSFFGALVRPLRQHGVAA